MDDLLDKILLKIVGLVSGILSCYFLDLILLELDTVSKRN